MTHSWPFYKKDLHDFEGTMCPCGCSIHIDGGGDIQVIHSPFNVQYLLQNAEDIKNGVRLPDVFNPSTWKGRK